MKNEIIVREYNGVEIEHRVLDGYWNATAMCQANGKFWGDYRRLGTSREYFRELSDVMGIPITELVQVRQGGNPSEQGTWVHRKVAIHLAQWLNAKFAVWVTNHIEELLTKGRTSLIVSDDPLYRQIMALAELRLIQVEQDRKVEQVKQLSLEAVKTSAEAKTVANVAIDRVEGDYGYYTIVGWCKLYGRSPSLKEATRFGREVSKVCKAMGARIERRKDGRFGWVNSYPKEILREYFKDIFPKQAAEYRIVGG